MRTYAIDVRWEDQDHLLGDEIYYMEVDAPTEADAEQWALIHPPLPSRSGNFALQIDAIEEV